MLPRLENVDLFALACIGIIAALWCLPSDCNDVPGFLRFASRTSKNLLLLVLKLTLFTVAVVIYLSVAVLAVGFLGVALAMIAFCAIFKVLFFGKD